MQGVSGANSKGAKVGFGGNPIHAVEQGDSAATDNTFSLRAKALVVREGFDAAQNRGGQASRQIDTVLLARVAIEEELKRKGGGGGGGSVKSFNPNLWVSYSYKLINDALQQLYDLFNKAMAQGLNQGTNTANNIVNQMANMIGGMLNPVLVPTRNFFVQLQKDSSNMLRTFLNNPLEVSLKLVSNFAHVANLIFSAVINGLKKTFYGKEEDKLDPDNELYESDGNIFAKMLGLRGMDYEDNEATGKSMKAHLDNIAQQYTRWVNSFSRR